MHEQYKENKWKTVKVSYEHGPTKMDLITLLEQKIPLFNNLFQFRTHLLDQIPFTLDRRLSARIHMHPICTEPEKNRNLEIDMDILLFKFFFNSN